MQKHNVLLTIHYDPVVTDDEQLNRMRDKVNAAVAGIDNRLSIHDFRMVEGRRHTNLIFDLVVPYDMRDREKDLYRQIDAAVQFEENMEYHTIINFDESAFNQH